MTDAARRVAAIILAAGESRRFGSQKLIAPLRNRPLLQHVLDAANASSLEPVALVVGANADDVLSRVQLGRAQVVRNPAYASGQASSLQAGLRAVGDVDAAVVLLGDQPGVTAALCGALIATQRSSGAAAVVSMRDGRRTPPVLLHRDLWAALHTLRGDVGARDMLAGRDDVVAFEVTPALGSLDDVDTPVEFDDLTRRVAAPESSV